jgi:hypothetical protein
MKVSRPNKKSAVDADKAYDMKSPNSRFLDQTLLFAVCHAIWQGQKSWNSVAIL